ncbi:hypothetical protein [Cellulomonas dongxiuzhuiae]|uniref:DUF3558 domain-containing protein n=1 Tax=Cellulomonas dongxiuzhuiae TaxID=2819979 RepID=A0ABX8GGG4_9CELL|nr:hypothetical protein [Cellulomonas dongxiuzhuiae]MBO3088505.1 hypothetical protein [Cellulomonas dongxiuzhuiae]MBO3094163.1 hypothetical protein [Cellulomonas dongxiuzhuiae]QWC15219.1 hypothetical protein KKR89_12940 [Cellulomonas dongxiuzhuiae]
MRAARRGATAGIAVLALAGCDQSVAAQPAATTAEVRTDASCLDPEVLDALGLELDPSLRTGAAATTTRGLPPEGFVADTALLCDRGGTLRDSAGRWWAVTSTRLEGDLEPLVRGVTGTSAACGVGIVAQVWLVDALGAAVLLPREAACSGAGLPAALEELDVVDRTEHPVALEQPVTADVPAP